MIAKNIILLWALIIAVYGQGCTPLKRTPTDRPEAVSDCKSLIAITDQAIAEAGVRDAQDARIPGYPYLRSNRFFSSFRDELQNRTFESWLSALQTLGASGWQIELNNLPLRTRSRLDRQTAEFLPQSASISSKLAECGKILSRFELSSELERNKLRRAAAVPAEYNTWQQVLGLYPLTAIPFRLGIRRWHQQTLATFNRPLALLPVTGRLMVYAPETVRKLSRESVAGILRKSSKNPLHIPMPSKADRNKLFETFAPSFEIDRVSENDAIGSPRWDRHDTVWVDTARPVVYRHLSHTRIGSRILLQLNYVVWFPSRPKSWAFDLLSGHLDGIIWRVTLNEDGNPLVFDSIHPCGCYHFFFPTQYARVSQSGSLYQEPAFMPQGSLVLDERQSLVIRVGADNHYIQRIHQQAAAGEAVRHYRLESYDTLRSLAVPAGGNRSLFNQDGIVTGSERGERFLFWPMGIPDPGAMRQWGHQATAFVGRRHFDDARIFEGIFEPIEAKAKP